MLRARARGRTTQESPPRFSDVGTVRVCRVSADVELAAVEPTVSHGARARHARVAAADHLPANTRQSIPRPGRVRHSRVHVRLRVYILTITRDYSNRCCFVWSPRSV